MLRVIHFLLQLLILAAAFLDLLEFLVMDRETFKTMWEMSASGAETEHLFLRSPEIEFYAAENEIRVQALKFMPDVSPDALVRS